MYFEVNERLLMSVMEKFIFAGLMNKPSIPHGLVWVGKEESDFLGYTDCFVVFEKEDVRRFNGLTSYRGRARLLRKGIRTIPGWYEIIIKRNGEPEEHVIGLATDEGNIYEIHAGIPQSIRLRTYTIDRTRATDLKKTTEQTETTKEESKKSSPKKESKASTKRNGKKKSDDVYKGEITNALNSLIAPKTEVANDESDAE